jgi:hypothetical protein
MVTIRCDTTCGPAETGALVKFKKSQESGPKPCPLLAVSPEAPWPVAGGAGADVEAIVPRPDTASCHHRQSEPGFKHLGPVPRDDAGSAQRPLEDPHRSLSQRHDRPPP